MKYGAIILILSTGLVAKEGLLVPEHAALVKIPEAVPGSTRHLGTEGPQAIKKVIPSHTTLTSRITKKDLGYSRMMMKHYPSEFSLMVNGKELKEGESLPIVGDKVTVEYAYAWQAPWGKKEGKKRVTFALPPTLKEADIQFGDWKTNERILIPGAQRLSAEEVVES